MLTTDLSLRLDPAYEKISRRFFEHPDEFADAFARAWFKLTHRDMPDRALPRPARPEGGADLAGPGPGGEPSADRRAGHCRAEGEDLASGLTVSQLVSGRGRRRRRSAAPTSAAVRTARIRLAPQKDWEVNQPAQLKTVLQKLEAIQKEFNGSQSGGKKVSLADLIVLGGCAAIEKAAARGHDVKVPFTPGRMDASQEQTDANSFAPLEPVADGFRNYYRQQAHHGARGGVGGPGATADADRARDDGAPRRPARPRCECRPVQARRLHQAAETLTNDFFVNLLSMDTQWQPAGSDGVYEGRDSKTNEAKWTGTAST